MNRPMWLNALLIFLIQSSLSFLMSWVLDLLNISISGSVIPMISGLVGTQTFAFYKEQRNPGSLVKWGLPRLSALVAVINLIAVFLLGAGFVFLFWREQRVPLPILWSDLNEMLAFELNVPMALLAMGIALIAVFGVTWLGLRMGVKMAQKQREK